MSASETGDDAPLVHIRSSVRNIDSASAPASRTVSASSDASRTSWAWCTGPVWPDEFAPRTGLAPRPGGPLAGFCVLASGNRQTLDAQGRCIDAIAKRQVIGRGQRFEHVDQMPGNGDLADGIAAFAVLNPEPRRATAVIAGHPVDT